MRVVVVGAGLGGLCLAQGLRQAGIEVEVYERDPGITARFQGFRIGLHEVGMDALRGCLPRRWHALLEATVGDLQGPRSVVDSRLDPIGDLGPIQTGVAADRHVLRHLLLAGLDEHLHTGKALTGYRVRTDGTVEARFTGGTTALADLLVGADGIGSAVRGTLSPATTPTDTGVRFVIGRTPLTDRFAGLVPGFGTKIDGGEVNVMLGLMRFRTPPPVAAARLAPEVALPDVGDYVRWVMLLPPAHPMGAASAQAAVLARTQGWHPDVRALFEQADPDNSMLLSIKVVQPGERWPTGPVTLLGDAVHATSPSGGNGANTALRDAELLRRALIEVAAGRRDLLPALDDYERRMFEYGTEAVRRSLAALPAFIP